MVKKKGKSKRTTLKDKYKIQKRTAETHRKRKREAKRDSAAGVFRHDKKKKDPGIPNSWPFKQDLLKDIQRAKERQQQNQNEEKERKKTGLRALREHQEQGGSARTVEELMARASRDHASFEAKTGPSDHAADQKSDGSKAAGQASRRAYLRELKKVIDGSDVLLQILDARDPNSSRIHPSIEEAILSRTDKRMVLVLNKIDLVPKEMIGAWLTYLRRSHPAIAIKASPSHNPTDRSSGASVSTANADDSMGMEGLLQLLKNYARTGGGGGKSKTSIVVGIIGYPNVGKSSVIRALTRSRAVGISPRPGFTTSMQEVVLDRNVRLLDSPGVVFDDRSAMLGNCVDADSIDDPIPAIESLLKRCNQQSLIMNYNIPAFPLGDAMTFLALVAKSYGRVLKGGIPDKVGAARTVLKDWNQGKIPYYTAPPATSGPEVSSDAVIVSKFAKEFDLSKFDDEVLNRLKGRDEMDFVKLEDSDGNDQQMSAPNNRALNYLAGKGDGGSGSDDDNDDESMDDNSINSDEKIPTSNQRIQIANADDYDFEMM